MRYLLTLVLAAASCLTPSSVDEHAYDTAAGGGYLQAADESPETPLITPEEEKLRQAEAAEQRKREAEAEARAKAWRREEERRQQQELQRCKAAHAAIDRCAPRCKSYQLYKLRREITATCP